MRATLGVPENMVATLRAFVETEGLPFHAVSTGDHAVRVVESEQGQPSTPTELRAGGSITCGLARDMAANLGVKSRDLGKLLDHLDIKVRACDLGCFE